MNLKNRLSIGAGILTMIALPLLGSHYSISRDNGRVKEVPENLRKELFNINPGTILLTIWPITVVHDENDDGEADYTMVHYPPTRGVALKQKREPTQAEKNWYREELNRGR